MRNSLQSGFVLLYAVLVASVVAIGGALLADIILKQLILSSVGRESQFAYYAATAGDECFKYVDADRSQGPFGTVRWKDNTATYRAPRSSDLNCIGGSVTDVETLTGGSDGDPHSTFRFIIPNLERGACAVVEVTKQTVYPDTMVKIHGYNQGDGDCNSLSPRRIEKTIYRVY